MSPELSIGFDFVAIAFTLLYITRLLAEYVLGTSRGTPAPQRAWVRSHEKRSLLGQVVGERA